MRVIGDRISILKKEDVLSIVILSATDRKKVTFMLLWLIAWSVCGIIVFANYFKLQNQDAKIFVLVYLSFWAYFEFRILRSFAWKRGGKEKLWVQNGIIHYQRQINGRGKIREYNLELVDDLKILELNPGSFSDYINQSFWIKGGERLEFTYQGKHVAFGMQITDDEARTILKDLKGFIKK
jgi:hypothetical protein